MNRVFAITAASERISTGGNGSGEITFTVTNSSARPLRGQLRLRPLGSTKGEWLSIAGDAERALSPNATQQVVVKVATPQGVPAGKYQFRLDAISVINPDDDFTEGPTIDLEVKATEAPKKAFPWWIVAAAAGAVILIGTLTWWLWPRGGTKVVFEDNFDEAPKGAWSQTKTETTPNGKTKFLGQFESDTVKLTLNDLPPHKIARIDFDLYIINTWEGGDSTDGNGPDILTITHREEEPGKQSTGSSRGDALREAIFGSNSPFLLIAAFSNLDDRKQSFACEKGAYAAPFCYFGGEERATYGAAEVASLGFKKTGCYRCTDSVYKIKRVIAHDKSQLSLTFVGQLRERIKEAGNEGWGLDNVRVEIQ
jgi:hypothetical protein